MSEINQILNPSVLPELCRNCCILREEKQSEKEPSAGQEPTKFSDQCGNYFYFYLGEILQRELGSPEMTTSLYTS